MTQEASLKSHIRTVHDGLREFKCEQCGKFFSQPMSLKTHIRTVHEGRKDYICTTCEKSFKHSKNLRKHIAAVHKDLEFKLISTEQTQPDDIS